MSAFAGCKKNPLDITPDGRITIKDVFQDEEKVEAYLNTVYSKIPPYFNSYGNFCLLAGATDNAIESNSQTGTAFNSWNNGGLTIGGDPLMPHYSTYWAGIRFANVFLENIDQANVPSASKKSRMKAEARLLRAFYYWQLIKQYGPMPYITKPLSASFDFSSLKRPSFQDNVDSILNDCNAAIANPDLPMRITQETNKGRMTKAVAYAIESEATLFNASPLWNPENDQQKWVAAANISKQALDALTQNGEYALWRGDWGAYFLNRSDISPDPKDRETIYERKGTGGSHLINHECIPSKPGRTKAGSCPSQELVDCYNMQATGEPAIQGYQDANHLQPIINTSSGYDPQHPYEGRDPRFYATVWYNGAQYDNIGGKIHTIEAYLGGADQLTTAPSNVINTHTGYYLRKFIDPKLQVGEASNATWKIFRLAEIYLNLAEAENEAHGPTNIAYAAIDSIRARVNMPDLPEGLTKEAFRKRVHNERRVEFAIEGKRFWDVRRWKILDQTGKLVTGMNITKVNNTLFHYKRFVAQRREAWQKKYLVFPIPISDVANIPDFAENQNPGW